MKLSLYSGMKSNDLPTFLCFFLQLLLWFFRSFVFVLSCLLCFRWLMFLRSSSLQIELGATKELFIIGTSPDFPDKSCISKRLADKMSDFVSTILLIIFSCQCLEIFLQIQVEGILVFLIISLFGIHTFRKSWPLSDLSVFDIMWHPLMLLEIEEDNFWYWGPKLFFCNNKRNRMKHWTTYFLIYMTIV